MIGFNSKRLQLIAAMGLCIGLVGCDAVQLDSQQATLLLEFAELDDLGVDFVYEGWLLVNGTPVSTGRFISTEFEVQEASIANVEAASKFIVTIEPNFGDDPAPADTHVLAGDIINSVATLTIADEAALATDFVDSTGSFIIATPTEPTASHTQGLWWLAPGDDGNTASLNLPALPAGWVYEGWVADADGPVSTGTFTDGVAPDSDGGGVSAGPLPAPPFPGQDFIDPARVIIGMSAVISVEPSPDNSPEPFSIKPLIDDTIEDVGAGAAQDMVNVIGTNQPSGTLTIVMR